MLKVSTFLGEGEYGLTAVPLFGPADAAFEKVASANLLPEVLQYISGLRPLNDSQYVLVNALGASEFYGCFPAGTLVETDQGEKPIEDIELGEQVRTHLNRFRPVVARRVPRKTEELCDLYVQGLPSNLPSLTATPNHELWAVTREDFLQTKRRVVWKGDTNVSLNERREQALRDVEFSWVAISDLRAGDYIAEPFPLEEDPKALGDEKWNCPEVAFLMGLYAAEGCIALRYDREDDRPASVIYVVSGGETTVVDRARRHAETLGYGLQYYKSESGTSYRMQLCFAEFARLCERHISTPAVDKKLSTAILRMPKGWQKVFLAAYAAGDGCVRKSGKEEGAQRIVSASAALLRGVRLLLARQGLVGSVNGRHNKKATWYNGNPIYELSVSSGQLNGRGAPKSYIHPDGYILSSVKKVELYAWWGEVFDLTVEEDSSYTASGLSVHNSNINGDAFTEAALIHRPDSWSKNPLIDQVTSRDWPYGFPTFYNAHPFAHHRNKDPSRAYGEVELATWNDHMKRVELVVRVDLDKCQRFGGVPVWDKLKHGMYPDVSMGSRVPFDQCSICSDWKLYREGLTKFNPRVHRHPGMAVLEYHKKHPIRGLSITRKDYCDHARTMMNKILPDGRKVFVYNDFPRFFDISFVFIGADRTAKVMVFIKRAGHLFSMPSVLAAEQMGLQDSEPEAKVASVQDSLLKAAFLRKGAEEKSGAIEKEVVPSQFAGKAIPVLTRGEPGIPPELMDALSTVPFKSALATLAGLGIVLRPGEFEHLQPGDASAGGTDFGKEDFMPALARMFLPMLPMRSSLGPFVERRVVIVSSTSPKEEASASSLSPDVLRKIGSAYSSYRRGVMNLIPNSQDLIEKAASSKDRDLLKVAGAKADEVFTPLTYHYLNDAFMDELPVGDSSQQVVETSSQANADVQRGLPSRNTWN